MGVPMTPPQVWLICYSGSQNSGKQFSYIDLFIIQDISKDTDEQPEGKTCIGQGMGRSIKL
jgi:hypothetical protein